MNRGLINRYSIPQNLIGVHKVVASIVIGSLFTFFLLWLTQKQDANFREFVAQQKAGVFQGVVLSPLANPHTGKHEGEWIIAGAGGEGKIRK